MKEKTKLTSMESAARMLGRRPLSRLELKRKLHDKGFGWREAEETVQQCERYGFVNDPEVAALTVSSMRNMGDGSRKIKLKLRLRGFSAEDVQNGFDSDQTNENRNEIDVALQVLKRRAVTINRETDLFKRKHKALQMLASRGFAAETAYSAIEQIYGHSFPEFPDPEDVSQ